VIEFGAGKRVLERHLDQNREPTPRLTSLDGALGTIGGAILISATAPSPRMSAPTTSAVLMGMELYARHAVGARLRWTELVPTCLLSYACARGRRYSPRRALGATGRLKGGLAEQAIASDEIRLIVSERGLCAIARGKLAESGPFRFSRANFHRDTTLRCNLAPKPAFATRGVNLPHDRRSTYTPNDFHGNF